MQEEQFGFMKGKSTEHALSATVNEIEKGFHKQEFVVVSLLDIKGAFDNIKPSAIINAMRKQGVRHKVCEWNKQYLTNRRCSCTLSDKVLVAVLIMGSPQGGLLSPTCGWNCAMNGLLEQLKQTKTHCKAFADDGALITRGNTIKEVVIDTQKAINVAVKLAREMGVKFSAEKTVVMLFTTKRPPSYQMPAGVKLYGQSISFSTTAKYLGVTLDDKLS
jgi:hypothetical protein